jgi:hypothetical protein
LQGSCRTCCPAAAECCPQPAAPWEARRMHTVTARVRA